MAENPPNFLEQMAAFLGADLVIGEFKPCTIYNEGLDFFMYLERDTSYTSQYIAGTNIELLWDNHPDHGGKLVGVKINGFSEVAPPEVVEAYKKDNRR